MLLKLSSRRITSGLVKGLARETECECCYGYIRSNLMSNEMQGLFSCTLALLIVPFNEGAVHSILWTAETLSNYSTA